MLLMHAIIVYLPAQDACFPQAGAFSYKVYLL